MILVSGATGMLGSEICRLLAEQGRPVRGLVRASSSPDRIAALERLGVELIRGDLKDPTSLEAACRQVRTVISSATSIHSAQPGDSIPTVDQQGQLNLVEAAARAGVAHFIFVSFPVINVPFALQTAKRAVEERLKTSGMTYTVLQPTFFDEIWLSPALGFDFGNASARIYGTGRNGVSWISFRDVAACAVGAVENPRAANNVIKLGGPEALSPLEVVQLAQEVTGKNFEVQHVPEEAIRMQHAAATDPLQQTFAGLMLYYAQGDVIDPAEARQVFPGYNPRSVREYLEASA